MNIIEHFKKQILEKWTPPRGLGYKYQGFTLSDIEEALELFKAKLIRDFGPRMKDYPI